MLTFLISLVTGLGVPSKFAKPVLMAGFFALALSAFGLAKCAYDKSVINGHEQKIAARARPATDKAANERANDTIANAKNEQEMHDVIAAQPDQPITPTSRALSCQRLRHAGRNPAACR